jgi:hypothetical protein
VQYGRIALSREMLRMILDLPPWVKIEGAVTLTEDAAAGTLSLIDTGPFVGDPKDEPTPQLHRELLRKVEKAPLTPMMPVYATIETGKAELRELRGANT